MLDNVIFLVWKYYQHVSHFKSDCLRSLEITCPENFPINNHRSLPLTVTLHINWKFYILLFKHMAHLIILHVLTSAMIVVILFPLNNNNNNKRLVSIENSIQVNIFSPMVTPIIIWNFINKSPPILSISLLEFLLWFPTDSHSHTIRPKVNVFRCSPWITVFSFLEPPRIENGEIWISFSSRVYK